MPTPYLDFAHSADRMKLNWRRLPADILANRARLQQAMNRHDLRPYKNEWWHFEDRDINSYPQIAAGDFPEIDRQLLAESIVASKR
jgi:D-alanyl-D-alanine dipeptidase